METPTNKSGPPNTAATEPMIPVGADAATVGEPGPRLQQDATKEPDTSWDLIFLAPSTFPGSLGRLGNCEVLSRIGQGGMGIVLKGFDATLQRTVAIKVMHPILAASEQNRRRFLREARTAASINHPNVVTIHAVDEQKGMPYLIMEFIEGATLSHHIRHGAPLTQDCIVRVGTQIAAGLWAAHRRGIIHRDIKPSNILLSEDLEQVKITDFGLAVPTLEGSQITSAGKVVGTPTYMSPEQVSGDKVDARSDLFSLGCVLYAMASGKSPFQGSHQFDVAQKIRELTPTPLHNITPGVSEILSGLVERLLAKNREDRFQTADEVVRALSGQPPHTSRRQFPWRLTVALTLLAVVMGSAWAAWIALRPAGSSRKPAEERPPKTLTVAQRGRADHATIRSALAKAGPGDTLRILDDGNYEELVQIDRPDQWRGVTVVGEKGPTLVAPGNKHTALMIHDTQRVTVRGLRILSGAKQHCIMVHGNVSGLTLDRLTCSHPEESQWAHIYLEKAWGLPDGPIRLVNSVVEFGDLGIVLESGGETKTAHVKVLKNIFRGKGMHIVLSRGVEDVVIQGNVFVRGTGIGMNLGDADLPTKIQIDGNSFFRNLEWMRLLGAGTLTREVWVTNNLLIGVEGITVKDRALEELAESWTFRNNWWEPDAKTPVKTAGVLADLKKEIRLMSRDPAHADFLRPPAGSPLVTAGVNDDGPRPIGALKPIDSIPGP